MWTSNRRLSDEETRRVRRAAEYAGLPWQAICTRPGTARRFYKRVEAEIRSQAHGHTAAIAAFAGA